MPSLRLMFTEGSRQASSPCPASTVTTAPYQPSAGALMKVPFAVIVLVYGSATVSLVMVTADLRHNEVWFT